MRAAGTRRWLQVHAGQGQVQASSRRDSSLGGRLCPHLPDHRTLGTFGCDDGDLPGASLGLAGHARDHCAWNLCYPSFL